MSPGTRRLRSARRADVPQPVEEETEDPAASTAPAASSGTNPATSQDGRNVESPAVSSLHPSYAQHPDLVPDPALNPTPRLLQQGPPGGPADASSSTQPIFPHVTAQTQLYDRGPYGYSQPSSSLPSAVPDTYDAVSLAKRKRPLDTVPHTMPSASGPFTVNRQVDNLRKAKRAKSQSSKVDAHDRRNYRPWRSGRTDDGMTEEAWLVKWITEGSNWKDWKDGRRKDQRERMIQRLADYFKTKGFAERTPESYIQKIKELETDFKKALRWVYSTGSGVYSQTVAPGDTRSPYQRELDNICRYYDELFGIFKDREAMVPHMIWSTVEEEAKRQSEDLLLQLLGLKSFDSEKEVDGDGGYRDTEDDNADHHEDESDKDANPMTATEEHKPSRRRRTKTRALSDDEDLAHYLGMRAKTEDRRLKLEEKKWKEEKLRIRAETVTTFMRGGLQYPEAVAAYKEAKKDLSTSESDEDGKKK